MTLIKHQQVVADPFTYLTATEPLPEEGAIIVPLERWLLERETLLQRNTPLGVLLTSAEKPSALLKDLGALDTIAIQFPKFADGRGYSIAHLLRERFAWRGTLRATGEILRDQLFYLNRCGFDAYELPEGFDPKEALKGLQDFSITYQSAADKRPPVYLESHA